MNQLIKKIYEDNVSGKLTDKRAGERIQQIDIYLKYVGKLDVPMPGLTPEQRREEERRRKKRAWNRTYMRRKYEKQKRLLSEKAEREAAEMVEIVANPGCSRNIFMIGRHVIH